MASFFAKKHNSGIIAWVIEEVAHNGTDIDIDLKTGKFTLSGLQRNVLFPFIDLSSSDLLISDIISGVPDDLQTFAANIRERTTHVEHHAAISGSSVVPCIIQENQLKDDQKPDEILSIRMISLPHISGIILIDSRDMKVVDYNASVVEQIFGYSALKEKQCIGWSVDKLIPNFTSYVSKIEETCHTDLKGAENQGLVVPEHFSVRLQFSCNWRRNLYWMTFQRVLPLMIKA